MCAGVWSSRSSSEALLRPGVASDIQHADEQLQLPTKLVLKYRF
jgi:hypothetical protein